MTVMRLGLLADPGVPAELADDIAEDVRSHESDLAVDVQVELLPALTHGYDQLVDVAQARLDQEGWAAVLCLTDSPLHEGKEAIVADILEDQPIAVASVPAFGFFRNGRSVRRLAALVTRTLLGREGNDGLARFRVARQPTHGVDARILAPSAHLRLLLGLVRANRPWRLLAGLRGALAAALGTSAYILINTSAWKFADQMSWLKLSVICAFAITGMVVWLVFAHDLWERHPSSEARQRVRLFNISTALTLFLGVAWGYLVLFAINVLTELLLIDSGFLEDNLGHGAGLGDYLGIAWFASSVAVLAGAVGSGFEDEEAVRQAAYSLREQQRQRESRDRESTARLRRADGPSSSRSHEPPETAEGPAARERETGL